MPTAAEPAQTRDARARGLLGAKVSAIAIVVASIATLAVVFGMLNSVDDESAESVHKQSPPAQPNTVSKQFAAPPRPSAVPTDEAPAVAPQPEPAVLAMDDRGFIDSTARCSADQQAVAIARTLRSAMVVCREADGTYEYTGTRLHDGASLRLDDVLAIPAGFEARNDGTTYRLSATELVVLTGEDLLSRDPIIEYRAG